MGRPDERGEGKRGKLAGPDFFKGARDYNLFPSDKLAKAGCLAELNFGISGHIIGGGRRSQKALGKNCVKHL